MFSLYTLWYISYTFACVEPNHLVFFLERSSPPQDHTTLTRHMKHRLTG